MLKTNPMLTCFALVLGSFAQIQANDLFSDVEVGTVFASASRGTTTTTEPQPTLRINRIEQLQDMLKDAGFEPSIVDSRTISTKKELSPWSFPVLIEISEDETQLTILLGLSTIEDLAKELPVERLLKLMSASQQHAPALFAYTADRKRTELSLNMSNSGLSAQMFRDQINRLAVLAKRTETIWYQEKEEPKKTESADTSLIGKWSASRSETEAVAIEFAAENAFNMVFVKSGSPIKSSGTFQLKDGTLTLAGSDGSQLTGKMTIVSPTEFRLEIQNGSPLTFKKAS